MGYVPIAEVMRGSAVESLHFGAVVVSDADGAPVAVTGDPDLVTYPRSSLKPFQALPLVESGAADAFGLTPQFLALACASHRAEPFQVALVREWLARLELEPDALACGPDYPRGSDDRDRLVWGGVPASRVFHNCSGKHSGLLTYCRHQGIPTAGYEQSDHPAQAAMREIFTEIAGRGVKADELGVDGCNLPAPTFSLREMAGALARFASARSRHPGRSDAMARLLDAMRRHPDHISGRGQPVQRLCEATEGRVLAKTGAEGFLAAWLPRDQLGIAIKIADGAPRARFAVLIETLVQLDLVSAAQAEALDDLRRPAIVNSIGRTVGRIAPCPRCQPVRTIQPLTGS